MMMGNCGAGMMLAFGLAVVLGLGLLVGLNVLVWARVVRGRRNRASDGR
jgi:hypothetical protein